MRTTQISFSGDEQTEQSSATRPLASLYSGHSTYGSIQSKASPPFPLSIALLAFAAIALLPTTAMASEQLELIPDYALFGLFGSGPGLGMMWKMLIGFALLVFPMNLLIFQPIFGALNERKERIQGARVRSDQLQAEADNVLERYESAIREARSESESNRQEQLLGAREEQAALTAKARGEAERELEAARTDLGHSLEDARNTLRASAEDLAQAAAEQVLGRAL